MTPLLSLIVPLYRVEPYLPDLIASLLRGCNGEQVEVIFVNDCSPDRSMARCRELLAQAGPACRFHTVWLDLPVNLGLAGARNEGMREAHGRYIGFVDSDDAIAEGYLAALLPHLTGSWDILEFDHVEFQDQPPQASGLTGIPLSPGLTEVEQDSPYRRGFFSWARIYRAEMVRGIAFPKGRVYEDVRYVAEATGRARRIARLPVPLVYYRRRPGSITATRNRRYAEQLLNLLEGTEAALPGHRHPARIVELTARKAFVILLKGLRISDRVERRHFFALCQPALRRLDVLRRAHAGSPRTRLYQIGCTSIASAVLHLTPA